MLFQSSQAGMLNSLKPTRYSSLPLRDVVCLCAESPDAEVWQEFIARVGKPIGLTIIRTASLWGEASRALVEDLCQVTYTKLWEDRCRLLRDFAVQHPDAILGYLKKIAANAAHDYLKHGHSQTSGGDQLHLSVSDVDPEAGSEMDGSPQRIDFGVFLKEVDQHLLHCSVQSEHDRDRMVFWLYFRQGMSSKEIASIRNIALTEKGVSSVIERLKRCIRTRVAGTAWDPMKEKE